MLYSIWKIPASISTFSYVPTNQKIQYEYSSSEPDVIFSDGEKVLVLSMQPKESFNIGITIIEQQDTRFVFTKDFEVSNGALLSQLPEEIKANIIYSDSNYIRISEDVYNEICSKVFSLNTATYQTKDNSLIKTEQIIYFGAPGTGKSFKVEQRGGENDRIRTTFHPDSDYSSFVGCYKPMQDPDDPKKIVYKFEGQCFAKAYVEAWKRYVALEEGQSINYTLVIEEINRGNCAQIFGDIFQLLDRKEDGFSQYDIKPDEDLALYLREEFKRVNILDKLKDYGFTKIANGIEMKLPPNLSIIATMNTSDQSLFPIDSAFKRRWDWEYIPIQYDPIDERGCKIANKINIDGILYDWGRFIAAVNDKIYTLTKSEDKELGYFFVRPDNGKNITTQRFVSKVLFYLWSDIYKDYVGRDDSIFKFSEDGDERNRKEHSFNSFFDNGIIQINLVKRFIEQFLNSETEVDSESSMTNGISEQAPRYRINGGELIAGRKLAVEIMKKYVEINPSYTPEEIVAEWKSLNISVVHFVETEQEFNNRTDSPRSEPVKWDNGNKCVYVTTNGWVYNTNDQYKVSTIKTLIDAVNNKEWGIKIDIVNP